MAVRTLAPTTVHGLGGVPMVNVWAALVPWLPARSVTRASTRDVPDAESVIGIVVAPLFRCPVAYPVSPVSAKSPSLLRSTSKVTVALDGKPTLSDARTYTFWVRLNPPETPATTAGAVRSIWTATVGDIALLEPPDSARAANDATPSGSVVPV